MIFYLIKKRKKDRWNDSLNHFITFSLPAYNLIKKKSFILIYFPHIKRMHIGKIYNVRKTTTYDINLTVREIVKISLSLEDIEKCIKDLSIFPGDIKNYEVLYIPGDCSECLKKKILSKNDEILTNDYFKFYDQVSHRNPYIYAQIIDGLKLGFDLSGIGSREIPPLTEEQVLDFEINEIFKGKIKSTPDGLHFFQKGGQLLYIQKVHNTRLEKCLGVDLIYNYYTQGRVLFIQYKCFNYKDKYYKSKDIHFRKELEKLKAIPQVKKCYNFRSTKRDNLRICRCPVFIKLCSREIEKLKSKPKGYYYPICIWDFIYSENEAYITFQDEPKITNQLFLFLARKKLIGTTYDQIKEINQHILNLTDDRRLKLIFTESRQRLLKKNLNFQLND